MATMKIQLAPALASLFVAWFSILSAQAPSAPPSCVERLVIPQYPISARSAGVSGTVEVVLAWAEAGKVQWRIESSMPHFNRAVGEALTKSRFAQSCPGGAPKITFDFILSGSRRQSFRQEVVFKPPSRFQIVTDLMELNP